MSEDGSGPELSPTLRHLAAGIAHDVNNSLGVIIGNVHLAAKRLQEGDEASTYLSEIRAAAQEARALMHEVGLLGSDRSLRLSPMSIAQLIEDIGSDIEASVAGALRVEQPDNVPEVLIDAGVVVPIIQDLCRTLGTQGDLRVAIGADEPGFVSLSLTDDGPALTDEELGRALYPFQKLSGRRNNGLSVVRAVDAMHRGGGYVRAHGADGGLSVVLLFPRADGDLSSAETFSASTGTIRYVGIADQNVRRLVVGTLRSVGFTVQSIDRLDQVGRGATVICDADSFGRQTADAQSAHTFVVVGPDAIGTHHLPIPFTRKQLLSVV